jgi:hypothetical protein
MPAEREVQRSKQQVTFDDAASRLASLLKTAARMEIVADTCRSTDLGQSLLRLRDSMRSQVWKTGTSDVSLDRIVRIYDRRTRQEGFHVLHDWDGVAERVNDDAIAVDVLNYLRDHRGADRPDATVAAILLDYYFLYLLTLLSLRIWDDGNADDNLERLNALVRDLQGDNGSGHQFVRNAETLLLLGTSHYEPHDQGYITLLEKVRTLNRGHRKNIALVHAGCMGAHLRFGFEATYGRDMLAMRMDNTVDYPWVCFSLATLMREYSHLYGDGVRPVKSSENVDDVAKETIVEAILGGLSSDPRAFVGEAPSSLADVDRSAFIDLFHRHRQDLAEAFERYRPLPDTFSPLSFCFNFSYNVVKGIVVDAVLRGKPWDLTLNDLLTAMPRDDGKARSKETLAKTLMGYARANPDRIRGRLMPVIVYEPRSGHRAFSLLTSKLAG